MKLVTNSYGLNLTKLGEEWLKEFDTDGNVSKETLKEACINVPNFKKIRDALDKRNIFISKHEFGDLKKVLIVLNKVDILVDEKNRSAFMKQYQNEFSILNLSLTEVVGIDILKKKIFDNLDIIRVYTKKIGKPIIKDDPVVLHKGATVMDAAEHIHKDFKRNMKFARLWNEKEYSGQRVEKSHILNDEDVLEFHV